MSYHQETSNDREELQVDIDGTARIGVNLGSGEKKID